MHTKLISMLAAVLAAGALTACGSSQHSSSTTATPKTTSTPSTTSTPTSTPTTTVAPAHGKTTTARLGGVDGKQAAILITKEFGKVPKNRLGAHLTGLQGLTLPQKISTLASGVNYLWTVEFRNAGAQLTPASLAQVQDAPVSCGNQQYNSTSAPEYCPSTGTIVLPMGTIQSTVAPLGDAALLLLISDLYGYHVENALGAFNHGYTPAQLEKMDSCFSGVYFLYAESENQLQPTDEESVNKLLALEAPTAGSATQPGAVTAKDLANAFNQGILSGFKFQNCIPTGAT